jgi:hypothetical protein
MIPDLCKKCSSHEMKFVPTKGPFLQKNNEKVYLSEPLNILTCLKCSHLNLTTEDKDRIAYHLHELAWEGSGDQFSQ